MRPKVFKTMFLKEFGEERIIRELAEKFKVRHPRVLKAIGDDASVTVQKGGQALLATTDILIEDTHFRARLTPPCLLGRKSLSISLSDIAAMGGSALFFLVSIGFPGSVKKDFLDSLYKGISGRAKECGALLIGGNTARSGKITVSTTVLGEMPVDEVVYRSGAGKNDLVWVTGTPGESALGLTLLKKHGAGAIRGPFKKAVMRHLDPTPRMKAGRALAVKRLATSMIDISDGVLLDLKRVIEASGAGAVVELDSLPVSTEMRDYIKLGKRPFAADLILSGGEDYELLFTAPEKNTPRISALSKELKLRITPIGRIVDKKKGLKVIGPDGTEIKIKSLGFEHFK
ncbi:MAG: thiamine-phosphate kinase [Deltaproteobacteria bacterium]|nr:thiamine-phosphate kinase [Deltaproteobacteria bacterium]